ADRAPRGLRPRYEHATFLPAAAPPRLWVFGGAHPAGNRSCVQVLDLEIGTWESPEVRGVQPLPRTFHTSSAAVGDCLYVFGGGDKGAEPVQDQRLHVFDTGTSGRAKGCGAGRWNPPAAEPGLSLSDSEMWECWAPALATSLNGWVFLAVDTPCVAAGSLALREV
uniref:Rab9 effector protein with kelch motifs n=1 Tax=Otus sunia TaxID=257818 RepID=A0A8C8B361_9STRI